MEENMNAHSRPSDLKITDMRVANVRGAPFRAMIIRIDTNQGHLGLRRGARWRQRDLRADAQKPLARRKPLQR